MGYGDEIMAAGEAKRLQDAGDPRPVAILDRHARPRWHGLWQGNPRIARAWDVAHGLDVQRIVNGPRCRPYVDYARMEREFNAAWPGRPYDIKIVDAKFPWRYTDWRASPGELCCVERLKPRGYIVVEPNVKGSFTANKDWGWGRWQALVHRLDLDWVQLGPPRTRLLEGVTHIETPTFLDACRVLSGARAAVLPEGGLHHAAAALGIPAVVIFGGMMSPANTGYEAHVNLFDVMGGASPCGMRAPCDHCARAMAAIRPNIVAAHLEQLQ